MEFYLESTNCLHPSQYGFRPGRCIEDITLQLTSQINNWGYCAVVYLDLQGAFDGVWHHGLLCKAARLRFRGNIIRWLQDYLSERTQSVIVHRHTSAPASITVGVPQGAALSPLLFNIMMYDLFSSDHVQSFIFADDRTVACSGSLLSDVELCMQDHLNRLSAWFAMWCFQENE